MKIAFSVRILSDYNAKETVTEMAVKFVHTNLIARDWRSLANFYGNVFGCEPVPPERDLSGEWVDRLTGMTECRICGVHLALPGYTSGDGPTLEIFSYVPECESESEKNLNSFGLAHLAFHVDCVEEALEKLLAHGGTREGELVKRQYPGVGELTAVYARDPEGNLIELQNWSK